MKFNEMVNNKDIVDFRDEIEDKREVGALILDIKKISPEILPENLNIIYEIINEYVKHLGYTPLVSDYKDSTLWNIINKSSAKHIASYILSNDLAYMMPAMETSLSETYADKFFDFFSDNALYFTNAKFCEEDSGFHLESWNTITDATFDTGIIIFDGSSIGLLWVMDED